MSSRVSYMRWVGEGFLIVASILLAFAIEAWWEDRRERAEELEILIALQDEFAQNRQAISEIVTLHKEAEHSLETVSRMDAASVGTLDDRAAFAISVDLMRFNTFDDRIGTLDGVIASAKLVLCPISNGTDHE